ncbi:MAG: type II secretion system major pseudopilin GspG [Planctomycetes bacterium]|nr:type II secretion system major pseudopilin GspG [Planctomycetota bacterium]
MSNFGRSMRRRAFTLVELIVVIAIISILATLVIVRYAGKTDQAKVAAAKAQLSQLDGACIEFQAHCNRLPNSLRELIEKPGDCPNWQDGGYLKGSTVPKDPWDNEYVFRNDDGKIEIVSYGSDGKQGGTGPATDLSSLGTSGNE